MTAAPQEGPSRGKRTARLKQYYSLSALGIEMGVTLAIGLLMGWFNVIDERMKRKAEETGSTGGGSR